MRAASKQARAIGALLLALVAMACAPATTQRPVNHDRAAPRERHEAPLRAGTSGNYPPLSSWSDGRATGFAPALLEAFAREQGREVAWTRFRWPDLAADLRTGRFSLAADGITVRPERSVAGRFTVPIARGGAILLVRRSKAPAGGGSARPLGLVRALDQPGFRVVVNRGGHLERVTRGLFHAANVQSLADNGPVREALARGDADAAMTNTFEAPRWAEGLDVERIGPLTQDVTALWLRADEEELAARLDAWLLREEASGRLGALRTSWLGAGGSEPAAQPVSALLAATAERLALMPLVAAAKRKAGKPILDAAQEERVLSSGAEALAKAAAASGRAAPPRAVSDPFFRAQMEAAKLVQSRSVEGERNEDTATYTLEELRAAIARITECMAFIAVRVPPGATAASIQKEADADLAETGLDAAHVEEISAAIAAFARYSGAHLR
jgi:cyclohexadienyl dehydratase